MKRGELFGKGLLLAGLALSASTVQAQQVIERDTKVTGPKGRSIQRDVRIQRGPGYVDRDITIKRPSGTITRDTRIATGGFGPGPVFRGPGFGPRGVIVENFVGPPVGLFGLGIGPVFNFGFGGGGFGGGGFGGGGIGGGVGGGGVGGPGVVPPPNVVVQQPNRFAPPSTVVVDPVAQALDRLKSFHAHSRRDACLTLGQLGDNRAVPALSEKVEKDFDKEVRQAAAWALGEIGDPKATLALRKASMYDHRHEVRDVAAIAIKKLGRAPAPGTTTTPPIMPNGEPAPFQSTPSTTNPLPDLPSTPPATSNPLPEPRFDAPSTTGTGTPPPPPMPDPLGDLPPANPPR